MRRVERFPGRPCGVWPAFLVLLIGLSGLAVAAQTTGGTCPPLAETPAPTRADGGWADLVFVGGDVVTVDPRRPEAAALAVRGQRILAVGSVDDVLTWKGPDTRVVDLAGRALMPGIVEAHTHPVGSARLYAWIDMSGFSGQSAEVLMARLKEAADAAADGDWVLAFGFDPILTPGLPDLDRHALDAISTRSPIVVLLQAMHTAYASSAALAAAGVDAATPDPVGGHFARDEDGVPTGVVIESPAILQLLAPAQPDCSTGICDELIAGQLDAYARAGVTTLGAVGLLRMFADSEARLATAARDPRGAVRVVHYLAGNLSVGGPVTEPFSGDLHFRNDGLKLWVDGSPYTGTMLLGEPYPDTDLTRKLRIAAGGCGQLMMPVAELTRRAHEAHAEGRQLAIHAQGDVAVATALQVYEDTLRHAPPWPQPFAPRHRIEHLALAGDEELRRAAALGLTVSFHVNHLYYYGDALRDEILGERAERMMPVATALRHGHRVSIHHDSPMYPVEPFVLMRTAVTRRTRSGRVLGADEAITVDQALRAMTLDAAWQLHLDDQLGSLEVGKLADLVVLSENPRRVAAEKLGDVEVLATYVGGRRIAPRDD